MNDSEKPKIIVDEDWKSQVERERQEADADPQEQQQTANQQAGPGELPPASFEVLLSTIGTQAMAAMGHLPDPETGQPRVYLEFAKLQVDLLGVLAEKTKGNLTDDEQKMMDDSLHQLRMLFVATSQAVAGQNPPE